MAERIPSEWKNAVLTILRSGDEDSIIIKKIAIRLFNDLFPCAFTHDLLNALINGLGDDEIKGRQIFTMDEEGTTWEFIFTHQKEKLYGKICLTPDNKLVIIYSAHAPRKGDTI